MSYQRDRLGQDPMTELPAGYGSDWTYSLPPEDFSYLRPDGYVYEQPAPQVSETVLLDIPQVPWQEYGSYPATQPAPTESSWSWENIWKGIAPVIQTSAEAFAKIYPAITKSGQAQMPIPAGSYRTATGAIAPIPTGYKVNPVTGKLEPVTVQAGVAAMTASPYFWPVMLGLGAMFLMTSKKGR